MRVDQVTVSTKGPGPVGGSVSGSGSASWSGSGPIGGPAPVSGSG
ncbi:MULTISPECIES: hypothetical protein [unclassified Streptomyces]|nr:MULTISPECIES: hypothetical protein [unclassified Streptomyces]